MLTSWNRIARCDPVTVSCDVRILKPSEEAAKGALLYTYKHAACGFSAKLTPKQVEQLSKQPGVLQVVKDGTMRLLESPAKLHTF
ncbi:putative peptidase S8 propeptide/proteinase inhibitor I9 [Helianthus annuus]|nr:putative peptidase S8 propeptide/proteinase inhibitor I9 [Helianthus annuus]